MPDSKKRTYEYKCDYGDCEYKSSHSGNLTRHKRVHTGEKPKYEYKCDHGDCKYKSSRSDALVVHKRIHTGEKKFKCNYENCKYKCSQSSHLIIHKRTHTGERPFKCDICGKKFSHSNNLITHKRIHSGATPYACDYENCKYKCSDLSTIIRHKRTHTGLKPFECDICGSKFAQPSNLIVHKRTHSGERPFVCDHKGCESKFSQSCNLIKHKKTHTINGQIRRKIQENNLNNKLKNWGFSIDVETTINSKRGECLDDTNRYYSRLDYHVINCTNAILLIECDEDQHVWYELSCEFSRMSDVRASLVKAGYELPIYWIRYNPNGKYHIGSKQVKIDRPKREVALKAKLEELCSPDFVPDKQVNIHYMFYDLMSEELGPEIMAESDFPEYLQKCVSWH